MASIAHAKEALEEIKRAAAERAAKAVAGAPSEPPFMDAFIQQLSGLQATLSGVQAEGVRDSLKAKYQGFLDWLRAAIPVPPRPSPGSPPPPSTMEVDEADLMAAVEEVGGAF